METARRDPHHHVRRAVDGDGATHDLGVAAERALPEVVPEDDAVVLSQPALLGEEAAAGLRHDAESLEEARGYTVALDSLRDVPAAQVRIPPLQGDQVL